MHSAYYVSALVEVFGLMWYLGAEFDDGDEERSRKLGLLPWSVGVRYDNGIQKSKAVLRALALEPVAHKESEPNVARRGSADSTDPPQPRSRVVS